MVYGIEPYQGVGPVQFGMPRNAVRQAIGKSAVPFDKSGAGSQSADRFEAPGIVVYYDPDGTCEAVEFNGPESPVFDGQSLLGMPQRELEDWLKKVDPGAQIKLPDVTSGKLGIAFFVREERTASALVFKRGYFDA
jgi:hypothetical protein